MADSVPEKIKLEKVNVYRFLVFFLNHSVLYDESAENYDPNDQQALDDIRHKMNKYCNIDESFPNNGSLTEKFKKLRKQYRVEKKKTNENGKYKPTLYYYFLMDAFLGKDQASNLVDANNIRNFENLEKQLSAALSENSHLKEQLRKQNNQPGHSNDDNVHNSKRKMEMTNSEMPSAKKAREPTCEAPKKVGPILGESSKSSSGNQRDEATRPKAVADKVEHPAASSQRKRNSAFCFLADVKLKGKTEEQLEKMIEQSKQFVGGICKVERIGRPNGRNISKVCIQIDSDFYSKIEKDSFQLKIGSDKYELHECDLLVQCYNCWAFGHKKPMCRAKFRCPRCGDKDCPKDCRKRKSCPNCVDYNLGHRGTVLYTSHPANDHTCPRRAKLEKIERAKVNYPEP